ncbi:MAG: TraB/GumN family protein [archaeon]
MHIQGNFAIIGSSHIASQSVEEVKRAFDTFQPDIVALELDQKRFTGLLNKEKNEKKPSAKYMIKRIGLTGFLFAKIGEFAQKKLGEIVNMDPGSEMITAIKVAGERKIQIALIDQDIEITLKRLSKKFTFKEKMRLIGDVLSGLFGKKEVMEFDLSKVPPDELIKKMVLELKTRYPSLYNVLVMERNIVMERNLKSILTKENDKKVLVIVGAGHFDYICKHISNFIVDKNSTIGNVS